MQRVEFLVNSWRSVRENQENELSRVVSERTCNNSRRISHMTGPGKDLNGLRFSWNSSKETPVVIFKNPEALKTLVK